MPRPPIAHVINVAHSGQSANTTGVVSSAPRANIKKPLRLAAAGDCDGRRTRHHWPTVQVIAPPTMTKPWVSAPTPWIRSAANGTKLSTPKNAAVARARQAMTAARPGAARPVPAGSKRRSAGAAKLSPAVMAISAVHHCWACRPNASMPTPTAATMAIGTRVGCGSVAVGPN